jgi:hypothetical protein
MGHTLLIIILAGLAATATMDLGSLAGMLLGIPGKGPRLNGFDSLGRWILYFFKGRFTHANLKEEPALRGEAPFGVVCHYTIGTVLTLFYLEASAVLGIHVGVLSALVYGLLTNVLPWFIMFPAEGYGILGRKAHAGTHLWRMSLWNHFFFGVGIAIWTAILKPM